jgi:hypothetical protein
MFKGYEILTEKGHNEKDLETIKEMIDEKVKDYYYFYESKNKAKDKNTLLEKMNTHYEIESNNRFSYFVKNISNKVNTITGEIKFQNFDAFNGWKYKQNIFTTDAKDFKLIETKKNQFLDSKFKQWATTKISRAKYLDYYNKDKIKLFITLTLPSKFHPYNSKNNSKNKNYDFENIEDSIEKGFEMINKIHRNFYNLVKKKLERANLDSKFDYLSVIEPHKSLIPHNHSLYYIDKEQLEIFEDAYNQIIKKYSIRKHKMEILKRAKGSSYIYKYLLKMEGSFSKYKKYFSKYRIFKISNFKHTTQKEIDFIYKYLYKHKKRYLDYLKAQKTPLYVSLENFIVKRVQFNYEKVENFTLDKKEFLKYIQYVMNENIKRDIDLHSANLIPHVAYENGFYFTKEMLIKELKQRTIETIIQDYQSLFDYYKQTHTKKIKSIYLKRKNRSDLLYFENENNFISQSLNDEDIYNYWYGTYEQED